MQIYQVKSDKLHGTNFSEVCKKAFELYRVIKKKSKRRSYVRSAYFNKEKIFLELFWQHLHEKLNHRDKVRRVRFFPCAIELVQHTKFDPESKENVDRKSEILHRFAGKTKNGEIFFVQIKEDKKSGQKWFMSVFPID
ncbi:MAG TPA: hypothetical protein DEB73_03420 [Candidatus Magasanikbacteria bacterium]|uniref:Uncharacterized protein n=2 Tax=Candidatus Magasanikiibacteriota TaxID=1752731 RepID=A0A0G0WM35_9BACT|nr:MAG: hypothetical protein UU49_C0011G0032 [Candidatus Magasanikbacteria bacterium GW2011_GWC2_41_17]KKS13112.1 MAG: hypothetical protein UU69_C0013G0002 [Candidatus Magasanikbacteria bacterium GW2011_GWA2_41_55]HBV58281.1 hypothetical protein [Candidatus Magasanikbacteria bacterium]HBX16076.1 hypothetical protein [Candidatus Magasanikbacteria bacterium]